MANVTQANFQYYIFETQDHLLKLLDNELVFGKCLLKPFIILPPNYPAHILFVFRSKHKYFWMYQNCISTFIYIIIIDEVVDSWTFMSTPWPVLSIISVYLLFVLKLGPNMMENRKPFNIKYVMLVYNAIQTIYNAWLIIWVSYIQTFIYFLFNIQ